MAHIKALLAVLALFLVGTPTDDRCQNAAHKKLELDGRIMRMIWLQGRRYLSVYAELTNVSADTFLYVVMSCEGPFGCGTNSKHYSFDTIDCLKNIPQFITLPPGGTVRKKLRLAIDSSAGQRGDTTFKIYAALITLEQWLIMPRPQVAKVEMKSWHDLLLSYYDSTSRIRPRIFNMEEGFPLAYSPFMKGLEIVWSKPIVFKLH